MRLTPAYSCLLAGAVAFVVVGSSGSLHAEPPDGSEDQARDAYMNPRLDPLFDALRDAETTRSAREIEQEVWSLWAESGDPEIDARLRAGMQALDGNDLARALHEFNGVVERAPWFAEGWNKRATVYWLLGRLDESRDDITRTLQIEPRHFGALSGLALVEEARGRPFEALEALEKVIRIHPRMPHLEERIDALTEGFGEAI